MAAASSETPLFGKTEPDHVEELRPGELVARWESGAFVLSASADLPRIN